MEDIKEEELMSKLYDYIVENYYFDSCDYFGNEMQFTLENGKVVVVNVNVKLYEESEENE